MKIATLAGIPPIVPRKQALPDGDYSHQGAARTDEQVVVRRPYYPDERNKEQLCLTAPLVRPLRGDHVQRNVGTAVWIDG